MWARIVRVFLLGVVLSVAAALLGPVAWAHPGRSITVDCATGSVQSAIDDPADYAHVRFTGTCLENLVIDRDVHLIGAGPGSSVLDGGGAGSVVTITDGDVVLFDLVVRGGRSNRGGGIDVVSGAVTLHRVVVRDNVATSVGGGGIWTWGGRVAVIDSVISDNVATSLGGEVPFGGGGIAYRGLELRVVRSAIVRNQAIGPDHAGGGIESGGVATILNSTISGNVAARVGGGISNVGPMTIEHTTITDNGTLPDSGGTGFPSRGGGIVHLTNTSDLTLRATLVAGNRADVAPDCAISGLGTPMSSLGYNLIGDGSDCALDDLPTDLIGTASSPIDPRLASLGDYGGYSPSHPLRSGSPALDHVAPPCPTMDQRLAPRPQGAGCDIGSIEDQPPVAHAATVTTDEDVAVAVHLTGSDADADPLSFRVVSGPSHGALAGTPPRLTYTPVADYGGPDAFTFVASDGDADSTAATVTITVRPVDDEGIVEGRSGPVAAGGTITTDESGDGTTGNDPVETTVISPVAGWVSIAEGVATGAGPGGFEMLGVEVAISAPAATAAAPLVIHFRIDAALIPPGADPAALAVFRDGVAVAACPGATVAAPDPCVAAVTPSGGDVAVTVLTSSASAWRFGFPYAQHTVGAVDATQGMWHLRGAQGAVTSFFYGNPGDTPFTGDWDCDGVDTPGLFRTSDAFAYLRNRNSAGIADVRFFFGNPDDVPLAGDFDGDGCDTVSLYRPGEQRFYIVNRLGENEGGLGAADHQFVFGNPGDQPVVGDWDGDGIDEVGLHRETTGFFYYRNTLDTGVADGQFYFGDPGDRFVAGDWGVVDGADTPGLFRPADVTLYYRHRLVEGVADSSVRWAGAEPWWLPVAGDFGLGGG